MVSLRQKSVNFRSDRSISQVIWEGDKKVYKLSIIRVAAPIPVDKSDAFFEFSLSLAQINNIVRDNLPTALHLAPTPPCTPFAVFLARLFAAKYILSHRLFLNFSAFKYSGNVKARP